MVSVLWHHTSNVDKQEMDALMDIAVSSGDTETKSKSPAARAPDTKSATKSSRKRPREDDDKSEQQGV